MLFEYIIELFFNFLVSLIVFILTVICGLSLTCYSIRKISLNELIPVSFGLGLIILAFSGIIGIITGFGSFFLQILSLLVSVFILIFSWKRISLSSPDRFDIIGLLFSFFYLFLLISTLTGVGLWRAGDPSIHASVIKLIIDNQPIPFSLPPFGNAWDYYPKGFHIYSSFFSWIASVSSIILIIPALVCSVTPLAFYSLIRQYSKGFTSFIACVALSLFFPIQYAILIWGGYPTASAFLLMLDFLILVNKKSILSIIFFAGMLITHTRIIGFAIPVLFLEYLFNRFNNYCDKLLKLIVGILIFSLVIGFIGYSQLPSQYLLPIFTEKETIINFGAMWIFSAISLFGLLIGWKENKKVCIFGVIWAFVIFFYFILGDLGLANPLHTAPDRILSMATLPFSIFLACGLKSLSSRISLSFLGFTFFVLIILGLIIFGMVFSEYGKTWELPEKDEKALEWLSQQNYANTICLNPDGTGTWVYPLTGIPIGFNPLIFPHSGNGWDDITINLSQNPNSPALIESLREKNQSILVYISSITKMNGSFETPFRRYYHLPVSNMDLIFSDQYYVPIYCDGTVIYKYKGN